MRCSINSLKCDWQFIGYQELPTKRFKGDFYQNKSDAVPNTIWKCKTHPNSKPRYKGLKLWLTG